MISLKDNPEYRKFQPKLAGNCTFQTKTKEFAMKWTYDRENTLKKLWKEGKTASEIAETLGGTTRNAVIGKVNRLGIQRKNDG
jgi:hypothetical protein